MESFASLLLFRFHLVYHLTFWLNFCYFSFMCMCGFCMVSLCIFSVYFLRTKHFHCCFHLNFLITITSVLICFSLCVCVCVWLNWLKCFSFNPLVLLTLHLTFVSFFFLIFFFLQISGVFVCFLFYNLNSLSLNTMVAICLRVSLLVALTAASSSCPQ